MSRTSQELMGTVYELMRQMVRYYRKIRGEWFHPHPDVIAASEELV